jgi:hypothetical protein
MTKPPEDRVIGCGGKATLLRIISDDYGVHANVITINFSLPGTISPFGIVDAL